MRYRMAFFIYAHWARSLSRLSASEDREVTRGELYLFNSQLYLSKIDNRFVN